MGRGTLGFFLAEYRAHFSADPAAYNPAYGGFGAWAVSQGDTAPTDPAAWRIVDGRFCLNYNQSIKRRWERDIPGLMASANANWPGLSRAG